MKHHLLLSILTFMFATATMAQAQRLDMPRTVKLYNNANGEVLGTATISGRTFYLRDLKGELVGTVVIEKDNKRTFRDPSGSIVEGLSIAGGPVKVPDEPQDKP
jgi:hypothetical protein